MKALFVTGQPGCGKTTIVQHLVDLARSLEPSLPLTGFVTEEVTSGVSRIGFDAVAVCGGDTAARGTLARKGLKSKHKTGAYGVDVPSFEQVALPLLDLHKGAGRRLVVIDEVGRMEMHSVAFTAAVKELFADDGALLLGSVAAPRYGHTVPLAEEIKARKDVCTLHLKPSTREEVRKRAEEQLRLLLLVDGAKSASPTRKRPRI